MTAEQIKDKLEAAGACLTTAGVIVIDMQRFTRAFLDQCARIEELETELRDKASADMS